MVSLRAWVSAIDQAPPLVAQARLLGGRLLLDFAWLAAELDDATGTRLVQRVLALLRGCADEEKEGPRDGDRS